MKITSKILHYPPYISTRWNFVQAIYLKGEQLVVCLKDHSVIEIPGLSPDMLEVIFDAHADFLEAERSPQTGLKDRLPRPRESAVTAPDALPPFPFLQNPENLFISGLPAHMADAGSEATMRVGFGSIENLGAAMHHNSAQANMPDLPSEILTKIAAVAKIVAPDDVQSMPKPEPHCNCTYCQIARAVHQGAENGQEAAPPPAGEQTDEEVSDAELSFQQWEIAQTGERLYSVVNRLDSHEKYSVYLGHPVGCTCGKEGCEHILAVLKS